MYNINSPRPDTDETLEEAIVRLGLTAPRVTAASLEETIASEHFFTAAQGAEMGDTVAGFERSYPPALSLLTFCVLVLKNGFTVTGESACASPENFNAEIGQRIARENAKQKIWALEGYLLKERLSEITR